MEINELTKIGGHEILFCVDYCGGKYGVFTNPEIYDNRNFAAVAIKIGEAAEHDFVDIYNVFWKIIDEQAEQNENACDWKNPRIEKRQNALVNVVEGYIL
jgi:hypothetical protein